ncbi:MAG: ATP phosphoribosyltransferase regulatory subunit [Bacillota bacterium]
MELQGANNKLQIPDGFKDFLPEEAYQKRLLEEKWIKLFKSWSYKEIVSSSFEFYDTLTMNVGVNTLSLLKTIDRTGHILALRPDMTSPIARLVATRMKDQLFPQRLFYLANVFRYENEIQKGRHREFFQAGIELIGPKGPQVDGEIIALAVEALKTAGLQDFQFGLGHVGLTKGLLKQLGHEKGMENEIKEALSHKNLVKLSSLLKLSRQSLDKEIFNLLTTQGDLDTMVQKLKGIVQEPGFAADVKEMEALVRTLKAYGVEDKVFMDLSILRDFNYYTGIVFEGYSENLGYPVCGGGRYDDLLGTFGFNCPATGFAIGIERVLEALNKEGSPQVFQVDYFIYGSDETKAIEEARRLRQKGYTVELAMHNLSQGEAEQYALKKGIKNILLLK